MMNKLVMTLSVLLTACATERPPNECHLWPAQNEVRLHLRHQQVRAYWQWAREIEYRERLLEDWKNHGIRLVYPQ